VKDRWTYNADHRKRPNLHPVAAPSGAVLTRDAPDDHPWHHGLWFTIKFVNGENFWEEQPPYGVLRHRDEHAIEWIRPDLRVLPLCLHNEISVHHRILLLCMMSVRLGGSSVQASSATIPRSKRSE
jgi:hypothetical protein